jgi:hypothetical protein
VEGNLKLLEGMFMAEETPLFTEAEWNEEVPKVTRAMHENLTGYCVPISKHLGDHGELWGTGTYLRLADRTLS